LCNWDDFDFTLIWKLWEERETYWDREAFKANSKLVQLGNFEKVKLCLRACSCVLPASCRFPPLVLVSLLFGFTASVLVRGSFCLQLFSAGVSAHVFQFVDKMFRFF
jgi:hypothetical protein